MNNRYLLDTNICIYIIKNKPPWVAGKFNTLAIGMVAISAITLAELWHGVRKSAQPDKNEAALTNFLAALDIVDFDYKAAVEYGAIRAALEKKGTPVGPFDMLIAATAKSHNYILVTNNQKEFDRIEGLTIESWAS